MLLERRAERIDAELDRAAADGWLIYDFRGSNPAFGRLLGEVPLSTRRAFLYRPRRGSARLLIHHVDAGNFGRLGLEMTAYGSYQELLAGVHGLLGEARRVLMEYSPGNAIPYVSRVDAGTLELIRSLGCEVLSSADALAAVVAAWDAGDIASHERAVGALYRAREQLYAELRAVLARDEVWTEVDAQRRLAELMAHDGLEADHEPIVAVNEHAADPHYAPAPEVALPIRRGDLLLLDLWGRETHRPDGLGAFADITWMASAAEREPADRLKVWETVRAGRDAAVQLIDERFAAGLPLQGAEVDQVARRTIAAAGWGAAFRHRTGHSIGWHAAHGDGVNIDDFETHDSRLLAPGASFSIEPGIYLGRFGMRSEINMVVTGEGQPRVTTPAQRELVPLV